MKCGVDLVFVPDFEKRARQGGETFFKKVFLETELKNSETAHLAGLFAAKEAVLKALDLPAGSWHLIEIRYQENGKPRARVFGKEIKGSHLSISHAGDYAVAVFVKGK
jgi:phosphopantetheine--protein transferase-like protein